MRSRVTHTRFVVVALTAYTGCTTSPVTTAAWTLPLTSSSAGACSVSGVTVAFGKVTADSQNPVTSEVGESVSEWTNCVLMSNTPGTFSLDATTEEGNPHGTTFGVSIPSITSSATQASPVRGSLFFAGPATGGQVVSGDCNFYFKDPKAEGVATGEIWAAYTCPSLTVGDGSVAGTCQVTEGYIAYRNCALGNYM
jgi:hypothetical protein